MSAVTDLRSFLSRPITVPDGSLLEHFYLNFGLNQLVELQESDPPSHYLLAWNVTSGQFRSELSLAIDLVRDD